MWSGSSGGADYTELSVDLNAVNPAELIRELLDRKLIAGDPAWFLNGVDFMPNISVVDIQGKQKEQGADAKRD